MLKTCCRINLFSKSKLEPKCFQLNLIPGQHLGAHQPRPRPADGLPPEAHGDVRHHRAGGQEEPAGRQGAGQQVRKLIQKERITTGCSTFCPNLPWLMRHLAEAAGHLGKMVGHPNKRLLNPGLRADKTPCNMLGNMICLARDVGSVSKSYTKTG